MIARVLSAGLLAGLLAGLATAVLQHMTTTPLILAAEAYEQSGTADGGARSGFATAAFRPAFDAPRVILAHESHEHAAGGAPEWAPSAGFERTAFTGMATVATAIGFAFLLIGGMLLAGDEITERTALAWAAAGFAAMGLAPAAGLAPELPGGAAAELVSRQAWWIGAAAATALALWMFLRSGNGWVRGAALLLLLAPHAIGAPHPGVLASKVPSELSAQFAAMALALQAVLWAATGIAIGFVWPRLGPKPAI